MPPDHAVTVLRARLLTERIRAARSASGPPHLTVDSALSDLRRYRAEFPTVPAEVTAMHLIRQVDQWDEVHAVQVALDTVIKEESCG